MNHFIQYKTGRTAIVEGRNCLFFSGYDYLGMSAEPAFQELLKEGIDKYGIRFPSSRISNTQLKLYEAFENKLCKITGRKATVSFSSGFAAGKAAAQMFSEIDSAPSTHPSIKVNESDCKTFNEWKSHLAERLDSKAFSADAVNIFTAEINSVEIFQSENAKGIIDVSHAVGVVENYESEISLLLKNENILVSYSLSKAFGLIGGAVSCSEKYAEQLRKTNEYAASTSMSPAMMFAFLQADEIYKTQQKKLWKNISYFISLIKNIPQIKFHPKLPVFILPENIAEEFLFQNNIIISSFSYPDVSGKKIKRIVLNGLHTNSDMEQLSSVLHELFNNVNKQ